ncbi:MAG: hypothetical protein JWO52_2436 [Gammaproteobacteria bacterium]|jgi:hypothetical protein|nr:hypothetical protein [Gammaproteobacteria bacterium]
MQNVLTLGSGVRSTDVLSFLEVSQTGDRCPSEEIQSFAMMARVASFVD